MVCRVILHLGSHKTGSTSIQSALKRFDNGKIAYANLGNANHSAPLFTAFPNPNIIIISGKSMGYRGSRSTIAPTKPTQSCSKS